MKNKYIFKAALCALLAAPALTSCELDQFPTGSLTEEESWKSYDDVEKQYVGLLSYLRSAAGSNIFPTELQSDLFNMRAGASSYTKMHNWTFTGNQFEGDGVWSTNFAMVKQANSILVNVDNFVAQNPNLTDAQLTTIDNIKGVAYFARAYAYNNMVVRYCKDYEPGTTAEGGTEDALGLPIVETVDKDAKPARATLKQTCAFIEDNMQKASEFLNEEGDTYHPGRMALIALRARYNLWAHKFDDAINDALEITYTYPVLSGGENLQNMWVFDTNAEIIYEPEQTQDELTFSAATIWVNYDIRTENMSAYIFGYNPFYLPTAGLVNMFEDSDYRKSIYFVNPYMGDNYGISGVSNYTEPGYTFNKYPGNQNLMKQPSYQWYSVIYNMVKAFRSAEDYLIIAEASLRKDNPDEVQAREYLNQLRESRGASYIEDNVTGDELLQVVKDEWTREFVGEGFRLDNLKRWHEGFTRMEPQLFRNPLLTSGAGFQDLTVTADNIRFIWEIPQQDLQANPNLQRNWSNN